MASQVSESKKTKMLFRAKRLRRAYRRSLQSIRYGRHLLNHSPILFANSFPKSGTHLLTQVLAGFAQIGPAVNSGLPAVVTYDGTTGRKRDMKEILQELQVLQPGDIAYGHLHAETELIDVLCSSNYASYFILRDPRDVVVSHVHYITDMAPNHIHHKYFKDEMPDFNARLETSITGSSGKDSPPDSAPLPDILSRFKPYLDWLSQTDVLILHFEALVSHTRESLERILNHALQRGFSIRKSHEEALLLLEANINPARSPTFRSGTSGAWRSAFNQHNKQLFKDVTGDMLIQLGYEQTLDW